MRSFFVADLQLEFSRGSQPTEDEKKKFVALVTIELDESIQLSHTRHGLNFTCPWVETHG
jgi:hypothetical protein